MLIKFTQNKPNLQMDSRPEVWLGIQATGEDYGPFRQQLMALG